MQGDLHVRFGGRLWETYHRKVARHPLPSLHVKYADEPEKLSIEMKDFLSPTDGFFGERGHDGLFAYPHEHPFP